MKKLILALTLALFLVPTSVVAQSVNVHYGNGTPLIGGADNSTNATAKTPVLPCVAVSSAPSLTNTNQNPCYIDLQGNMFVTLREVGKTLRRVKTASGANQDATQVGTGAKILYHASCTNSNASTPAWAHLYNVASPTSASSPIVTLYLPANAGNSYMPSVDGGSFATALSVRFVTTSADNSTTAMAAAEGICNFTTND